MRVPVAVRLVAILRLLYSSLLVDTDASDDDDGVDDGQRVVDQHCRVAGSILRMIHVLHRTLYSAVTDPRLPSHTDTGQPNPTH